MSKVSYGYTKSLGKVSFESAEQMVRAALAGEGFGILTEINVKETLKKKLGVDMPPYKILGACNPPFAHRALQAEPWIGLLLPCNVVLREGQQGEVEVSFAIPGEMMKAVQNPALAALAAEVDKLLQRALEKLPS
jgi:uncharacterized protein (DUF302 family)